ncbi:MAG: hypothetical protein J0L84_02105 [Verrucomicrobia bacterium]|nr:hypothetical protein [Verrucomicrobiota bacterium]
MRSYLIPSLDVRRDALMDSIVSLHRHALIWRRIAAGEALVLLLVVVATEPAFLIALGWLALHAAVLGGGVLLLLHRGNPDMGIAADEYTANNQPPCHHE